MPALSARVFPSSMLVGCGVRTSYSGSHGLHKGQEEGFRGPSLVKSQPGDDSMNGNRSLRLITYIGAPDGVPILEKIIAKERPSGCFPRWGARRRSTCRWTSTSGHA